jgi:glycerol uptake facilitator-like aquaporin
VRTNNIALNPARLVGPAIAQTVGVNAGFLTNNINYTD